MIVGVGTDIVSIARISAIEARYGERLAQRILSHAEFSEYRKAGDTAAYLAKRFAAKEAASKALGTGFGAGVKKQDISVGHDQLGRPLLHFSGAADSLCQQKGVVHCWLTLSDEKEYAVAFVVLERG